jgi:hypothetical protein
MAAAPMAAQPVQGPAEELVERVVVVSKPLPWLYRYEQ